jgi:hypothetical protein
MFTDPKPEVLGIAGGAVASALVDWLIEHKILTNQDARAIYRTAQSQIRDRVGIAGNDAIGIIEAMMQRLP